MIEKFITSNKGFDEAYKQGYEIWVECDKYYFILLEPKDRDKRNLVWKSMKYML